jgi:hypothetical protein
MASLRLSKQNLMRTGRLQESALKNIWKSLEPNLDVGQEKGQLMLPEKLQKQFIPSTGDSPLYRLISVAAPGGSEASLQDLPRQESITRQFLRTTATRVMSVPIIPNPLELELPSRSSQSTGNLFRASQISITQVPDTNPAEVVASQSSHNLNPRSSSNAEIVGEELQKEATPNRSTPASAPKKTKHWSEDYAHMDIDWSMQAMDVLYSASFYEYIRDERNCDLSAQRLSRIIKEYKPRQVANALLWMIQGWSVENTSKLLRIIFADWLPELAGCVFSLISRQWPKTPQTSLCTAFLLMNEPGTSTALFLKSLTQTWSRKESIDLLTYLDSVLKWSSAYLQEVMSVYAGSLFGEMDEMKFELPSKESTISADQTSELSKASAKLVLPFLTLVRCKFKACSSRVPAKCFYTLVDVHKVPS